MATKQTKTSKKQTAKEQGFPVAYLGSNGNFRPGMDARAKSDLVCAVLKIDNPKALHQFTPAQAQKLIAARGWQGFVVKKREVLARPTKATGKRTTRKPTAKRTPRKRAAAK